MQTKRRGLKGYIENPVNACSLARQMFVSRKVRTIVVEGDNDRRFFEQWPSTCKFHVCNGKDLVVSVYKHYRKHYKNDAGFMWFVVDIDFNEILGELIEDDCFMYNSLCSDFSYNDMEVFLVNTPAFEKVLSNFDIDMEEAGCIRAKLRDASAILGSFRVSDFLIRRDNCLSRSVLNGLEVRGYFNEKRLLVDPELIDRAIRGSSGYGGLYSEDLINKARELRKIYSNSWSLSRGHDVTEMLRLFLEARKKRLDIVSLEMMLRMACEKSYFEYSSVGKKFIDMGVWM